MSISNYLEEAWLKTIRGGEAGTNFTAPARIFVKLHTGDPGEAGTSNAAGNTTRREVRFGAPANPEGVMRNSNEVTWTEVSTAETYRYISLWDSESAGNCLYTGALSAERTVAVGDNFTLPTSRIEVTLD